MRQMWLGVNFFLWEARLRRQKKIGELSTEEIHRGYYTVARRYEFYVRVARTISHSFAALTREILLLPRVT